MFQPEKKTRINFTVMTVFIIIVYLPFYVWLNLSYETTDNSLSRIAWRMDGIHFLILFGIYTMPFYVFQLIYFMKQTKRDAFITGVGFLGVLCLTAALCLPFRATDPPLVIYLHNKLGAVGAVAYAIAALYVVMRHCILHKEATIKIAVPFAAFFILLVIFFMRLNTAAVFEVGSAYALMVILFFVNRAESRYPKVNVQLQ